MQDISKTEQAITLFNAGKHKKSFSIFKTFKMNLTLEEQRIIGIASECLNGNSAMYKMLDINPDEKIKQATDIITNFIKTYNDRKK